MKRWLSVVTMCLVLVAGHADAAKRFGGGLSFGKQSSNVTQRQAAPAPTQAAATKSPAAATPAAAAPKKPWGAMLGGLAAGLGLAWLASSLGMGEAMGQILMFALLAMVVMAAVTWFMRRKNQGAQPAASPFAFQGAGAAGATPVPASYRPENVGNDASARPWERNTAAFDSTSLGSAAPAASGSMIGSGLSGSQTWGIPEGFDSEGFLKAAKANFVSLQAAWDKSDIPALRVMMTDTMLKEIQAQLAEREAHTGGPGNQTEVVMIEAHLLGIEDLGDEYMASVEFTGMIREEPSAGPSPFREVWNMIKPKSGHSGWLVAGVQALQ
ncbi:Tim44 domain-containing protein [Rhodoferax sp.]|uniref:Tim44 domain-containing protein n=1 Tax=Rhodoferax sp. TaxID=50421 RepID=UPI0008C224FE|nr:TIM44-like domain-containing protein [Rhodoferax sp.]MDO8319008.1 TIM44-like domain-containing protein [Rhodoferax sp.]OGB40267.1 MAG: preprotein translocase subunit Tim44 [Burkholderiales bacterium RIFOXYC2_FULL_59_8]